MADFIDDEEIEQEDDMTQKRRHKRKKPTTYRLDEEDREVIKENTGIEVKPKNRLKRNAEKVLDADQDDKAIVKKEIEVREKVAPAETIQIDTTKKRRAEYKAELRREYYDDLRERNLDRQYENADKLR
jgi:hypothetical protein